MNIAYKVRDENMATIIPIKKIKVTFNGKEITTCKNVTYTFTNFDTKTLTLVKPPEPRISIEDWSHYLPINVVI